MTTPNEPSPQNRRIHPRYPVMWQGTISADTEFDAYVISCTIRNVSITGVHVLVDRAVAGYNFGLLIRWFEAVLRAVFQALREEAATPHSA